MKRSDVDKSREILKEIERVSKQTKSLLGQLRGKIEKLKTVCASNPEVSYVVNKEIRHFDSIYRQWNHWLLVEQTKRAVLLAEEDLERVDSQKKKEDRIFIREKEKLNRSIEAFNSMSSNSE